MALINLAYRDQPLPRRTYARAFEPRWRSAKLPTVGADPQGEQNVHGCTSTSPHATSSPITPFKSAASPSSAQADQS